MISFKDYLVTEDVDLAKDYDHLLNRVNIVADICGRIGNKNLLFREFKLNMPGHKLVTKITKAENRRIKGDTENRTQEELLKAIGIKNAVFCYGSPPTGEKGMHGLSSVVIPIGNFDVYYSPVVRDIGASSLVGVVSQTTGLMVDREKNLPKITAEKYADTYLKKWPKPSDISELHEIIVDCDDYYLLNVKGFIESSGKKAQEIFRTRRSERAAGRDSRFPITTSTNINRDLFAKKFSTYSDVEWYLRNPVTKFIQWNAEKLRKATQR